MIELREDIEGSRRTEALERIVNRMPNPEMEVEFEMALMDHEKSMDINRLQVRTYFKNANNKYFLELALLDEFSPAHTDYVHVEGNSFDVCFKEAIEKAIQIRKRKEENSI